MAIDYFNPNTGDQDFFNQLNTLVDTVSTLQDLPSGGATGGGTIAEMQDATTGRVTIGENLIRYLYRYIHFRVTSDPEGNTLIPDLSTFTGDTIYLNINNSESDTVSADAAYTVAPFAWASGHHLGYRVSGGGTILFFTQAADIEQPFIEIGINTGSIDLYNVSASGLVGPQGPQGDQGPAGMDGVDGTNGLNGFNNATVSIYLRSTTAPTSDPTVNGQFTFSTAEFRFNDGSDNFDQTMSNGWFTSPALTSGTDQLWVRSASAVSREGTDLIANTEWSAPVQAGSMGVDGQDGLNTATVVLYQRNSSETAPALPTQDDTFNFGTGALGLTTNNGWQQTNNLSSTGTNLWFTTATASSRTAQDTIASSEWSAARLLATDGAMGATGATGAAGADGEDGQDGLNQTTINLYRTTTTSTAPTLLPGTITYTFSTGATTSGAFNFWSRTEPSQNGSVYIWFIRATASSRTDTDTIAQSEWTTPALISQPPLRQRSLNLYQRSTTNAAPADPTGNLTYTFSTDTLTTDNINGWSRTIPSSGGEYLWVLSVDLSVRSDTATIAPGDWSSAVNISVPNFREALVNLYQRTSSATAPADPNGDLVYTFATDTLTSDNLNGWNSRDIPGGTDRYVWQISARPSSMGATATIAPGDWSEARNIITEAVNGQDGAAGTNGNVGNWIFIDVSRETETVATPAPSGGVPTGWTDSPPSEPTGAIWASFGDQVQGAGPFTWRTPQRLSGAGGVSSRVDIAYATNLPAQQSIDVSGTRSNDMLSAGGGSVPLGTARLSLPSNFSSGTNVNEEQTIRLDSNFNAGQFVNGVYRVALRDDFNSGPAITTGLTFTAQESQNLNPSASTGTSIRVTLSDDSNPERYQNTIFTDDDGNTVSILTFSGTTTTRLLIVSLENGLSVTSGTTYTVSSLGPTAYNFQLDTSGNAPVFSGTVSGTFTPNINAITALTTLRTAILGEWQDDGVTVSTPSSTSTPQNGVSFNLSDTTLAIGDLSNVVAVFMGVSSTGGTLAHTLIDFTDFTPTQESYTGSELAQQLVNSFVYEGTGDPFTAAVVGDNFVVYDGFNNPVPQFSISFTVLDFTVPDPAVSLVITSGANEFQRNVVVPSMSINLNRAVNATPQLTLTDNDGTNTQVEQEFTTTPQFLGPAQYSLNLDTTVGGSLNSVLTGRFTANATATTAANDLRTAITTAHPSVTVGMPQSVARVAPNLTYNLNGAQAAGPDGTVTFANDLFPVTLTGFDLDNTLILRYSTELGDSQDRSILFVLNRGTYNTAAEFTAEIARAINSIVAPIVNLSATSSGSSFTVTSTDSIRLLSDIVLLRMHTEDIGAAVTFTVRDFSGESGSQALVSINIDTESTDNTIPSLSLTQNDGSNVIESIEVVTTGIATTSWSFDPDVDNAHHAAGTMIGTTQFAENQTASQALTTIATMAAALDSAITWDGNVDTTTDPSNPSVDIVLSAGNLIRPSLILTQNNGANAEPNIIVGNQSVYTVFDYANREVVTFSSAVSTTLDSDREFIVARIVDAIDDNVETPIDFNAVRSGSTIRITALTEGQVTGLWSVTVNHGGGNGNMAFGTATVVQQGSTDFTASSFPSGRLTDNDYVAASAQGHNFIGERVVSWGEGQTSFTEPEVSNLTSQYTFSRLN